MQNPISTTVNRNASVINADSKSILAEAQELSVQTGTITIGLSWESLKDLDASAVLFSSTGTVVDGSRPSHFISVSSYYL